MTVSFVENIHLVKKIRVCRGEKSCKASSFRKNEDWTAQGTDDITRKAMWWKIDMIFVKDGKENDITGAGMEDEPNSVRKIHESCLKGPKVMKDMLYCIMKDFLQSRRAIWRLLDSLLVVIELLYTY